MKSRPGWQALVACAAACSAATAVHAADGFKLRFPLSGTLGGEIAVATETPGFFGSVVATQIELDKVTDGNGDPRQVASSGVFATPTPIAGRVRTATWAGTAETDFRQSQTNANLILGYLTEGHYGGGRLSFVLNLPYTTRLDRRLTLSGPTPTLSTLSPALTSPPLPAGTAAAAQAAAQAGFSTAYQAQLGVQSAAGSGVVDGLGDAELTAAWVGRAEGLRVVTGVTLAVPTGRYDAAKSINVGFGNFYTLRPGVALAYNPAPAWMLGLRASMGFNTRNRDNHIRSGDFGALDLALAYRSSFGVFGPHVLMVRQVSDDLGGSVGPNRFAATGLGGFFTTRVPGVDAALNLYYMTMVNARNALSGSFYQLRLSKAF